MNSFVFHYNEKININWELLDALCYLGIIIDFFILIFIN